MTFVSLNLFNCVFKKEEMKRHTRFMKVVNNLTTCDKGLTRWPENVECTHKNKFNQQKTSWTYCMLKMILAPVSLFFHEILTVIGDLNTIALFYFFVCLFVYYILF